MKKSKWTILFKVDKSRKGKIKETKQVIRSKYANYLWDNVRFKE